MPEQKTKFDDGRWKHEIRKVSDLHPNPDNPRTITRETLKGLKRSMQKNGYTHRIIVDCHNMILSGHARWLVFKEQDPDAEIECMVAQRELTKEEIQEAVLGHNTLGGDWNIEDLQMKFEPIILEAYGLKVDLSDDLDTKEVVEVEVPDEVPTRVQPGDIWQLGDHRLICGDSTKAEDVEALMDGHKADLLLTDPPYNMNYQGAGNTEKSRRKGIMNDNMPEDEFEAFLTRFFACAYNSVKDGSTAYVFYKEMGYGTFMRAMKFGGFNYKQEIIWKKDQLVLGGAKYQNIYEPFLMGCKGDSIKTWNGGRKQVSVMDAIDLMGEEELRKAYKELLGSIETDVVQEERTKKNDKHPTMKPVKLLARLIRNSSNIGDSVLDLFGGSGSTMMACEQIGRKCYMNELDPHYASVIVQRWVEFTGKENQVFRINPDGTKTAYKDVLCEKA